MPAINSDTREAWQAMATDLAVTRPSVGKTVKVVKGKKHSGKVGKVFWHGRDKYQDTRYKSDAQLHLSDMRGREGFRVGIETPEGEKFFVKAEYVEVLA